MKEPKIISKEDWWWDGNNLEIRIGNEKEDYHYIDFSDGVVKKLFIVGEDLYIVFDSFGFSDVYMTEGFMMENFLLF